MEQSSSYCTKCGAPLSPSAAFCGKCGTPIQGASQSSPTPPASTIRASQPSTVKQSHTGRNIGVIILVLALLGGVYYVAIAPGGPSNPYPTVVVSGTISTVGTGTHPIRVDFVTNSQTYSAQVNNGAYNINLPNKQSYQVNVAWVAFAGVTSGTCNGGTLNLDANSPSTDFSTSC